MRLILGDIHWGIRNSSQFYLNETLKYFDNLFEFLNKNKVEEIFVLGDFLDDRREINILVLNSIDEFLEKVEELKIPTYYLLGNHDIFYKNSNLVNGLKPLLKNYNYQKIIDKPTRIGNSVLIPWVNSDNKIKIKKFLTNIKDKNNVTVYGHFSFGELISFLKDDDKENFETLEFFKDFKQVYSGHYHKNITKNNVTYIGSILDYKWDDEITDHGFYIINNDNEVFVKNKSAIHKKYIVKTKDDLLKIISECENKEVKIILEKEFKISHKEYDFYISEIDKKCQNLQVLLVNEIFLDDENTITTKTFEEFIVEFFKNKNYGADIDNEKLSKIFLQLYNITKDEEL